MDTDKRHKLLTELLDEDFSDTEGNMRRPMAWEEQLSPKQKAKLIKKKRDQLALAIKHINKKFSNEEYFNEESASE